MDKCSYCKHYDNFDNWCENKNMAILMSHNYVCDQFCKINIIKKLWRWMF